MISYNGKVITYNDKWIDRTDPYNPLNLPPYTIRLLYKDGVSAFALKGTAVQVSSSPNVWDVTYENSDWSGMLFGLLNNIHLLEVLGANSTGVTDMSVMFYGCKSLTTVPIFDTSNVTDMSYMFEGCTSLTTIPLFDTSNVNKMEYMFYTCYNVESGALALYQQASTQTNPPTSHVRTFYGCGLYTETGIVEYNQIPINWK